jgi:hypothetical protein
MYFGKYGVNIAMSSKYRQLLLSLGLLALLSGLVLFGCSGNGGKSESDADVSSASDSVADSADIKEIQAMFDEAATRWHYGDKAVLYDLEFEYLQKEYTFDEYLDFRQVRWLEADTLASITVDSVEFFGRDSAYATATAMFVGPGGDTTYMPDTYPVYYHRGRWIHPTVSVIDKQLEFDERKRVADSAAAAEADLEGN